MDRQALDTRLEMDSCWDRDSEVGELPENEDSDGKKSRYSVCAPALDVCGEGALSEGVLNVPQISWSCSVRSRGFCMNMQNEEEAW